MNSPQPIETAPLNKVILTDKGLAFKQTKTSYWLYCDVDGYILRNETTDEIWISPTLWVPLPDWMHV